MRLRWTPSAARDLEGIKDYLGHHFPHLAQSTIERLYKSIRELKTMPHRGRSGRTPGTRELVFSPLPYIAVYRAHEETVEILHIYHGAQDRKA